MTAPLPDPGPETLPILYRDAWLVAVHKPAGLLVHRSDLDRGERRFAVQILRDQLGCRVYPVHRLDRGTSGLLLFALDAGMARALHQQFEARGPDKTYLAVVRGHPPEAGEIDHPLRPDADERAFLGAAASDARPARTRFVRLAETELPWHVDRYPTSRYALVQLMPETGRRHQLRRHMKHIAHPILGDATHGKGAHNRLFRDRLGSDRLLLAAVELAFDHPVSGQRLRLAAPLAREFAAVVEKLGWRQAVPGSWWPE